MSLVSSSSSSSSSVAHALTHLETHLPPLPLQQLVYRLAFSTMSNVQLTIEPKILDDYYKKFGLDSLITKEMDQLIRETNVSEMHNAIQVLTLVSPKLADQALTDNIPVIKKNLLWRIKIQFHNVMRCDDRVCADRLFGIYHAPEFLPLSSSLKAFSEFSCSKEHHCLHNQIPLETIKLLVQHGNKDHILKEMATRDFYVEGQEEAAVEVLKLALQHGANMGLKFDFNEYEQVTPLHFAATSRIAKCLLDHGAAMEARDKEENTPLHYAARWRDANVSFQLCERGANLEARNKEGETPIFNAIRIRNWFPADYMIKKGAKLAVHDRAGKSLLQHAEERQENDNLIPYYSEETKAKKIEVLGAIEKAQNQWNKDRQRMKFVAMTVVVIAAAVVFHLIYRK